MFKVGDIFCGCGGFSLGFDYLYDFFDVVYAVDNWQIACDSYKANMPNVDVWCEDVLKLKLSEIPRVDVLIGSPPCQEFTIAKAFKRGGAKDTRTFDMSLTLWFLSLVEYMKPKYWIMENSSIVSKLLNEKYPRKILRMSDYGVPQIRKRMFAGEFIEPKKELCNIRFPTAINEAGGYIYRPPNLGFRLGAVFRRRALIPEVKLVQTFPIDYVLYGSLSEQYLQLGNAVPPLMSYKLATAIGEKCGRNCVDTNKLLCDEPLPSKPSPPEKKEQLVGDTCGYAGACSYRNEDGNCLFKRPCKDKRRCV